MKGVLCTALGFYRLEVQETLPSQKKFTPTKNTVQHDIDFVKADIGQPYEKDDSYKPSIDSIIAAALSE